MELPRIELSPIVEIPPEEFSGQLIRFCNDAAYAFENKHDGYRSMVTFNGLTVRLLSKDGHEIAATRFLRTQLLAAFKAWGVKSIVLDCELVAFNKRGRPDFYSLKKTITPKVLYAFDLLYLDGEDVRHLNWYGRKQRLREFLILTHGLRARLPGTQKSASLIRYVVPALSVHAKHIMAMLVVKNKREGIVAKHKHGVYGDKTRPWKKLKNPDYPGFRRNWVRFLGPSVSTTSH